MKKAFTMLELVFVIVVIGILAAIAVPKFAATRDDATVTRASSTLSSIRSAIAQEAQRRQMEGNYTLIKNVGGTIDAFNSDIFDFFDSNSSNPRVLEYPPRSCEDSNAKSCWMRKSDNSDGNGVYEYRFTPAVSSTYAQFEVKNNRFDCVAGYETQCRILER